MFVDLNTIHNPATGTAAPAAWGDGVRDDLQAVYGPPRVRVRNAASGQSILTATLTARLFDTDDIDTHGMHDTLALTSRLTVPSNWDGDYLVGATVQWAVNTGGTRRHAELQKNGVKIIDSDIPATTSGYATQNVATIFSAVAGEYFELFVYQDSGSSILSDADGFAGTIFWAHFIGNGAG